MKLLTILTMLLLSFSVYASEPGAQFQSEPEQPKYKTNRLKILSSASAKEFCSCYYVEKQTEEYCRGWVKYNPKLASISFDAATRRVRSKTIGGWISVAIWVNQREGCVLVK